MTDTEKLHILRTVMGILGESETDLTLAEATKRAHAACRLLQSNLPASRKAVRIYLRAFRQTDLPLK